MVTLQMLNSGDPPPPPRPKIFSISCTFWENLTKSYVAPPPGGSAPPPTGNPGSAPGFNNHLWSDMPLCWPCTPARVKPRGDITRSPKQGYQWPHKWTCVHQIFFKKLKKKQTFYLQKDSWKQNLISARVRMFNFCINVNLKVIVTILIFPDVFNSQNIKEKIFWSVSMGEKKRRNEMNFKENKIEWTKLFLKI